MNIADWFRAFLSTVSGHPVLERLFFASVEFAALACLVWIVIRIARIKSARVMSLLWLVVLAKPIVSLVLGSPLPVLRLPVLKVEVAKTPDMAVEEALPARQQEAAAVPQAEPLARPFAESDSSYMRGPDERFSSPTMPRTEFAELPAEPPAAALALPPAAEPAPATAPPRWSAAQIAISLWLAGVAFFVFRSAFDRFRLRRLIRRAAPTAAELSERYGRLAAAIRIRHAPQILVTGELESPALVGSLVPAILIPRWLVSERDDDKIDWALRHELMHWKMFDPQASLVREVAQALFYFHPAVWWAGRNWEVAAELACDRAIITDDAESRDYAAQLYGMLVEIRDRRRFPVKSGLFATRTQIKQRIAALVQGPCRTRAHLGAFALVAVAVVSLAALSIGGTFADKDPPAEAAIASDSPETEQPADSHDDATFTYSGAVVDERGEPVVGAKIAIDYWRKLVPPEGVPAAAVSDDHGKFQFSRSKGDFSDGGDSLGHVYAVLIATKEGSGFAAGPSLNFETTGRLAATMTPEQRRSMDDQWGQKTNVLSMVPDDVPVHGRIVNIEGQPVVGAKIEAVCVWDGKEGTLDAWEAAALKRGANYYTTFEKLKELCNGHFVNGPRAVVVPVVRTDADGWFTLKGLGRERIAETFVSGPGIETKMIHVRTRRGDVVNLPGNERSDPGQGDPVFYPAEFTRVAGPAVPIIGRVTDSRTKAPLAGVVVRADQIATSATYGTFEAAYIRTVTDADGRYQLDGLPLGKNVFVALPPAGSPHIPAGFALKTSVGSKPLVQDIRLTAGVLVHGRVVDDRTDKPVPGNLEYFVVSSNPHLSEVEGFNKAHLHYHYRSDHDGRFEIPVLPGQGILAFSAYDHDRFPRGAGADQIDAPLASMAGARYLFRTQPLLCTADNYHLLAALDPKPGTTELTVDLTLTSGASIPGRVFAPDGEALRDYHVYGENYGGWSSNKPDAFEVKGYFPKPGRRLAFYHPGRNLVGERIVEGEPPQKLEITLRHGATLVGRVVDGDGMPLENATIEDASRAESEVDSNLATRDRQRGILPPAVNGRPVLTDARGRFELKGIIPGLKYSAEVRASMRENGTRSDIILGPIFVNVTAQPGETKNLGDVQPMADEPVKNNTESDNAITGENVSLTPVAKTGVAMAQVTVRGVVLRPDGKPAAGATVRAATPLWAMLEPIVGADFKSQMSETKTDAQGKFSISFSTKPFGDLSRLDERWREIWKKTDIAASLPGFGSAWVAYGEIDSPQPVTLRLVEDVPVRGRVVDLEGRPVAGTTVKVSGPRTSKDEDLTPWIEGIKAGELPWTVYHKASRSVEQRLVGTPTQVTTDRKGMFEIHGLGKERIVDLVFEGDSVAHRAAGAVTRTMPPIQRTISQPPFEGTEPVFGAEFTFTADPARTIEGVVRDANSGEHLAGVSVESYKLVGYPYSNHRVLKTKTDELGRFRLIGMPKGAGNKLLLVPNDEQPYFMREVDVPDPVGLGPAKMEIELHRGIWITGRVTDKATGQPVPGVRLHYLPFRSNEYAQRTPEFHSGGNVDGDQLRYVANPDGTYRLVGLPGRAIVGAESVLKDYCRGVGYDAIDAPKYLQSHYFDTYLNPLSPSPQWPSVMREINPAADAQSVALDLQLDPGRSLRIRVMGPGDEPLTGVSVTGLNSSGYRKATQEPVLVAANFGPAETRTVVFHHEERKIGRVVTIGPKQLDAGEMTVELQPCATAVGRILNSDGLPVTGMAIEPNVLPSADFGKSLTKVTTDADGRFRVTLLPGCQYAFGGEGGGFQFVTVANDISVAPGETKDLGTLMIGKDGKVVKQDQRRAGDSSPVTTVAARVAPGQGAARRGEDLSSVLRGRVTGPDGKPAKNSRVAVVGSKIQPERGGDLSSRSDVLAEVATDDGGRFEIRLSGVSAKTHSLAHIIARSDDSGVAWRRIDPDERDVDVSLVLPAEQIIRGRFIDIEGQPAQGVQLSVNSVAPRATTGTRIERVGHYDFAQPPRAWPPRVTANQDGSFAIRGIPADHGVHLAVAGNDRFAPQSVTLNTGAPEQRPESDATYRSLVRNVEPGEEAVLPLAPAQMFEGIVRFSDTGEPAPHARLTIFSSQQENVGSWYGLAGKADSQGRYRINPHPGVRFGITAFPPDGVPYLTRKVRDITHKEGTLVKQVDVSLPRGVLIRGRVVESGTKVPIEGAMIQYVPESRNNRNADDDIITGWQGIQLSAADGAFEIAVLPGPGTLLANGPKGEFVLREIGSRQLERGTPGGERNYAHAFQRINPEPNSEPLTPTLELQRGAAINIRLINSANEPVEHSLVVSRLFVNPSELNWRGFPKEALNGRFELSGLGEGLEYPVHFLDAKNRLGATAIFKSDDKSPDVVLLPCGQASATITDDAGQPLAGYFPRLDLVVTAGPDRFEAAAQAPGVLAGDAAYVVNIDRTNYQKAALSDDQGRITYPALIPGARYRIITYEKGIAINLKEFVAESGKTLELGKIAYVAKKDE